MIFLSAADSEAVINWDTAVECIRAAYAAEHSPQAVPGRIIASDKSAWIRCMPAIPSSGRYMGSKQIARTRDGKVTYLITLYDKDCGELAFLIDGIAITSMRTASTSVVALEHIAGRKKLRVGLIGSGLEARMHAHAICHRYDVENIVIYSPTPANRDNLATELGATFGVNANSARSVEAAVRGANCIIAAARSRDEAPLLFADWLSPGAVVVSIGSTTSSQREIDVSLIRRADLIVADVPHELANDTGDMQAATSAAIPFGDKLVSLQDLVQNRIYKERLRADLVIFKSVGSALQDIAFAEIIAVESQTRKLGKSLAIELAIKKSIGKNA